jgi:hypothetical protein
MFVCIYSGPAYTGAGYTNTHVIPTLKRVGKKDGNTCTHHARMYSYYYH